MVFQNNFCPSVRPGWSGGVRPSRPVCPYARRKEITPSPHNEGLKWFLTWLLKAFKGFELVLNMFLTLYVVTCFLTFFGGFAFFP